MGFLIYDGRRYIGKNNSITTNRNTAMVFSTSKKASNYMVSMKRTYKLYHWKILDENEDKEIRTEKIVEKCKEDFIYNKTIFDDINFSWEKQLGNIQSFFNDVPQYKNNLIHKQKVNELELCDIYHFIELKNNLPANKGYKIYKLLKEKLKERRFIKDELMKIDIVEKSSLDDYNNKNVKNRIEGLENRQYKPRVLEELFI